MRLQKSKKGSFFDNMSVFIWLIIIILVLALCMFVLTKINDQFQNSGLPSEATTKLNTFTTKFNGLADGSVILWLVILWIGTILSALFLDSYPIFFVIFITLSVVSFFILAPLANVMVNFFNDTSFASVVASLPWTMFFINNLLVFNALFIVTNGLALYAKFKRD